MKRICRILSIIAVIVMLTASFALLTELREDLYLRIHILRRDLPALR